MRTMRQSLPHWQPGNQSCFESCFHLAFSDQIGGPNRQAAYALSSRGKDGVGKGGRDGRNTGFADAGGIGFARNDVYLNHRRFEYAKHLVIVKIGLLHATVFQCNFSFQSGGKTKNDAAFHLSFDDVRIDGASAIDGANHAVDFNFTIFPNGSLDDLRDITVERKMCGDAATDSFGKRLAPTGFFRDKIQGGKHARLFREKLAAEL